MFARRCNSRVLQSCLFFPNTLWLQVTKVWVGRLNRAQNLKHVLSALRVGGEGELHIGTRT